MACECQSEAQELSQKSVLVALLSINGAMFVVELVLGLIADSTGLIADSLDMLADALVYGLALGAVGNSAKSKIRAAIGSGVFQIVIAGAVLFDIIRRAVFGSEPQSLLMWTVGLLALVANFSCMILISKHRRGEIHMRASWIFSKNDVISNLGVIVAGLLVYVTASRWPDLIIGLLISVIVFRGGLSILQEAQTEKEGMLPSGSA